MAPAAGSDFRDDLKPGRASVDGTLEKIPVGFRVIGDQHQKRFRSSYHVMPGFIHPGLLNCPLYYKISNFHAIDFEDRTTL